MPSSVIFRRDEFCSQRLDECISQREVASWSFESCQDSILSSRYGKPYVRASLCQLIHYLVDVGMLEYKGVLYKYLDFLKKRPGGIIMNMMMTVFVIVEEIYGNPLSAGELKSILVFNQLLLFDIFR